MTVVLSSQLALPHVEMATTARLQPTAPSLSSILRRLSTNLLVACAIPALVFTSLMLLINITAALLGTLFWSYSALGWQVTQGRRLSGLLVVTSSVLTIRTLVALASGDTFWYFLQPIATDAFLGITFFASLWTARPVIARLAGDFYPLTPDVAGRTSVARLFRRLTLLWAAACAVKATLTFWLLQTQSVETFVLVKSAAVLTLNGLTIAITVGAAVLVARREGLLPSRRPLT